MKFKIILTTFLIVCMCGGYWYMTNRSTDPIEVVELIQKNINHKGEISDWAGDINFRGFESVGYTPINGGVRIFFGDLQMDIKEEDMTEEFMAKLESIGFDIKINDDGHVRVKYLGKEVALFGRREN